LLDAFSPSALERLQMIKVLYVVPPSPHFAGIERVVHDIAGGLARGYLDRFDVTVLYSQRYAELDGELPYRVIWEQVSKLRTFPFRVVRWLRKERYDVVLVAQYEATALLWLSDRFGGGKTRFVMHLHGNPKIEASGSSRARIAFSLFNFIMARMSRVLAVSPSLARYLESRVNRPGLIEYMPNPVRQFSDLMPVGLAGGPVSFVSIGRLAEQKGHDILVDAMAKLVAQGVEARLTIVGGGTEHDALASQIERLGLQGKVILAGSVPQPAAQLEAADCFVSGSRWEGFGVAIVEALSAGLYVIATDCEFGPGDIIDMPEKGEIVPVGDSDAMAQAMINFVRRGGRDTHAQLRRDAAATFSIDSVIGEHAAMLESVVRQS
jgi:glycosyltransferase involved in cell wall biosynthesis